MTTPLRYPGGKAKSAAFLTRFFPVMAIDYREPFVGGGSMYFWAKSVSFAKNYWINDALKELIDFYTVAKSEKKIAGMQEELRKMYHIIQANPERAKEFYEFAKTEIQNMSTERAARWFFYLNRVTFSGTTQAGGFSQQSAMERFTLSKITALSKLPRLLRGTEVTKRDALSVIKAEGNDVFMFIDPPYYGNKSLYLHDIDHEELSDTLKQSKHKFLLTYDDCPDIRHFYKWCEVMPWDKKYGMTNVGGRSNRTGKELLIANYRLEPTPL